MRRVPRAGVGDDSRCSVPRGIGQKNFLQAHVPSTCPSATAERGATGNFGNFLSNVILQLVLRLRVGEQPALLPRLVEGVAAGLGHPVVREVDGGELLEEPLRFEDGEREA